MEEKPIITVGDLIEDLQRGDPKQRILMFSDPEGNAVSRVAYVGVNSDDNSIILVPMPYGED